MTKPPIVLAYKIKTNTNCFELILLTCAIQLYLCIHVAIYNIRSLIHVHKLQISIFLLKIKKKVTTKKIWKQELYCNRWLYIHVLHCYDFVTAENIISLISQ